MKYIDEYRDNDTVAKLSRQIAKRLAGSELTIMEVCGTHTMAIARFGIKQLLPANLQLISGPGCPVCVTPNRYLDHAIALSREANIIITTFGDMVRVPGSSTSLEKERATGADIRMVYSPLDALEIAKGNRDKEIVFLSVGFETTIPTIASTLLMAKRDSVKNFSLLTANKAVPPALEALVQGKLKLNGFLLPGHVTTIIGGNAYNSIAGQYKIPCSVAGFEPVDILGAILNLVEQVNSANPTVAIEYSRVVTMEGNLKAQNIINEVFKPVDAKWRGVGVIPMSGLELRSQYIDFDAAIKFNVDIEETKDETGCICGQILQGLKNPTDCPLFGKKCKPENPVGACMVSSEGTCAASYRYE